MRWKWQELRSAFAVWQPRWLAWPKLAEEKRQLAGRERRLAERVGFEPNKSLYCL